MKKFLVLGIGNAQVDLLKRLHGRFEVHALSSNRDGRGLSYTDHFSIVDITNIDRVLEYAQQQKIDYIYSIGSDVAMPTVTLVAEKLCLPTLVSHDVAKTCNNKADLRTRLKHVYGAVPFELLSAPDQLTNVSFPAMIKPVDSQGQRGVQTIMNRAEIPRAFDIAVSYSKAGKAILEKRVEGREISVNGYMVDGKIKFLLSSDREAWPQLDGGIIHKHLLPTSIAVHAVENVRRLFNEVTQSLGIKNGPVYLQIKMSGDIPYLIEVAPRLDGCHMWRLIKFATGVDLLECIISHLQGLPVKIPDMSGVAACKLEFFCLPPEQVFTEVRPDPNAEYTEYFYAPGDTVQRMNGYMEKCGYQIVLEKGQR